MDNSFTHSPRRTVEIYRRWLLGQNAHTLGAVEQDARGDGLEEIQRLAIWDLFPVTENEYDARSARLVAELSRRPVNERMSSESLWRWRHNG